MEREALQLLLPDRDLHVDLASAESGTKDPPAIRTTLGVRQGTLAVVRGGEVAKNAIDIQQQYAHLGQALEILIPGVKVPVSSGQTSLAALRKVETSSREART
jgi:hypothetical protein